MSSVKEFEDCEKKDIQADGELARKNGKWQES